MCHFNKVKKIYTFNKKIISNYKKWELSKGFVIFEAVLNRLFVNNKHSAIKLKSDCVSFLEKIMTDKF
ncbi:hypothetical protein AGMMS49921_07870 [Endomicrobiia bacterium]|nr:hypothetical protein AGMMS49921_07870 [Endomicrobiia bacterium]